MCLKNVFAGSLTKHDTSAVINAYMYIYIYIYIYVI